MIMNNELIEHLEMIHTTPMGEVRIKKNLQISCDDIVEWCKQQIMKTDTIFERKGKNWYVYIKLGILTINASAYTIITDHPYK